MLKNPTATQAALTLLGVIFTIGAIKFYHYNYIENTRGQARTLKMPGLREYICKGTVYAAGSVDQCGKRSIYMDPDWGVTAYFTVYGMETKEEADALAAFMREARIKSKQTDIPIKLTIYSTPRSAGSRPDDQMIFDRNL